MILDYIEQAGKGKYQCFKTKKICLDSVDNDTIAYNYDDKTIANATKSTFAETDHSRVKTVSIAYLFKSPKVPPPIFQYFLDGSRHTFKIDDIGIGKKIFPIIAGQIIVGCCKRKDRDTFKCWQLNNKIVMAMPDDYDDDDGGENFCRSFCETINSKVIDKISKLKDLQLGINKLLLYRTLVKDTKNLMVGGVLATIQAKEVYEATGIKPFKGILNIPGQLDKRNQLIIDNLPLDYSILDEIEYKYPMNNAYYGYTTRGCIRKCPFCAVPKLEPVYNSYIPLRERIEETRKQYGDQKDLLLMDNNILASSEFDTIINDIVACGFGKDAIFIQPDLLALSIAHLRSTPVINERANIRKAQSLIMEFYQKLKGEESFEIYKIIFEKYKINKLLTTTKEHLLAAYDEIKDIYKKHFKPAPRHRYVDFNQGVDARLFTEENVKQLSRIAIRPLRIAFDNIKTEAQYTRAIEMSSKVGLKDFSNYLLYNFDDHPDDLYHRLRINVELCDRLNVSIYSFPMKYHPIRRTEDMDEDYSHNRDYIGKYWNRKYIRAIQAVLNSTKGKIGKGTSFFMKAFGENIEEYHKLLEMPETMIIYRYFFEWLGLENGGKKTAIEILGNDSICNASAHSWWKAFCTCKENVSSKEWEMALNIIHKNDFSKSYHTGNSYVDTLLGYYVSYRQAIIEPNTDLYKLKQVYDQNPLKELRRTQKIK